MKSVIRAALAATALLFAPPLLRGPDGIARAATTAAQKGVNYLTGQGMDQLNCDAGNTAQVARDMTRLQAMGVQWVRIETAMTAISGLPQPPTCPAPRHEFERLTTLLAAIHGIGARPIVNIIGWHYPPEMEAEYIAWLNRMLTAAPEVTVFEIGDEENLSVEVQSYAGANPDEEPYGWAFHTRDFAANDAVGRCPTEPAARADLDYAVERYATWLSHNHRVIHAQRPGATVILGGLSSWQAACWLEKLGQRNAFYRAEAIGFHPYPQWTNTPQGGAATVLELKSNMQAWAKQLPIWITEFGFSTTSSAGNAVPSEAVKAAYTIEEFKLLATRVEGPIMFYTARDPALTAAQWASACAGGQCPGRVGGAGLFEWLDGQLIWTPSAAAFAKLEPAPSLHRVP